VGLFRAVDGRGRKIIFPFAPCPVSIAFRISLCVWGFLVRKRIGATLVYAYDVRLFSSGLKQIGAINGVHSLLSLFIYVGNFIKAILSHKDQILDEVTEHV
jgi:hypothetical protein